MPPFSSLILLSFQFPLYLLNQYFLCSIIMSHMFFCLLYTTSGGKGNFSFTSGSLIIFSDCFWVLAETEESLGSQETANTYLLLCALSLATFLMATAPGIAANMLNLASQYPSYCHKHINGGNVIIQIYKYILTMPWPN